MHSSIRLPWRVLWLSIITAFGENDYELVKGPWFDSFTTAKIAWPRHLRVEGDLAIVAFASTWPFQQASKENGGS